MRAMKSISNGGQDVHTCDCVQCLAKPLGTKPLMLSVSILPESSTWNFSFSLMHKYRDCKVTNCFSWPNWRASLYPHLTKHKRCKRSVSAQRTIKFNANIVLHSSAGSSLRGISSPYDLDEPAERNNIKTVNYVEVQRPAGTGGKLGTRKSYHHAPNLVSQCLTATHHVNYQTG